MGLFYSMMKYVKSFYPYSQQQVPQLSQTKISISAGKLIHTLRYKQIKVQKQAKNLQANLVVAINSIKGSRSVAGEQQLMDNIVRKGQLVAAYEEIIRCANIIKNQAKMLEVDSNKISEACVLAICTIIYAYKDLELSDCINLSDFVPEPHPVIDKKQISQALREYVEYSGATFFAINTYILEMCYRNQLTLQKVNEIPHNFSYSPSKLDPAQTKSGAMFALSLEQLGLPQQGEYNEFKEEEPQFMHPNMSR